MRGREGGCTNTQALCRSPSHASHPPVLQLQVHEVKNKLHGSQSPSEGGDSPRRARADLLASQEAQYKVLNWNGAPAPTSHPLPNSPLVWPVLLRSGVPCGGGGGHTGVEFLCHKFCGKCFVRNLFGIFKDLYGCLCSPVPCQRIWLRIIGFHGSRRGAEVGFPHL